MATSKSYFSRPNYRFLPRNIDHHQIMTSDSVFELDESDICKSVRSKSPEFRKPVMMSPRLSKKPSSNRAAETGNRIADRTPSSLPVNIPDWSKILRSEFRENRRDSMDYDDVDDIDDYFDGMRVPPHELLARTRIASFSVHEGIGRTLKGRDLSRVRNAIWEKTGFED